MDDPHRLIRALMETVFEGATDRLSLFLALFREEKIRQQPPEALHQLGARPLTNRFTVAAGNECICNRPDLNFPLHLGVPHDTHGMNGTCDVQGSPDTSQGPL